MVKELEYYREDALLIMDSDRESEMLNLMRKLQKEDDYREIEVQQNNCTHNVVVDDNHGRDRWCNDCGKDLSYRLDS